MAMTVGVARLGFYLEGTTSLKDKRAIVRPVLDRVRDRFNAGIAEVDDIRVATLAVVCVSNSAPHVDEMLATVISFIESRIGLGELREIETELIPFGD
jgi:uncharacterized protein YlxP (DUF503 family)